MSKENLFTGEIYHIYNRGVDKRVVFLDDSFYSRFNQMLKFYLTYNYRFSAFLRDLRNGDDHTSLARVLEEHKWETSPIELLSFCLMPNHYHLQVKQLINNGVAIFMHRIGTGFTHYFNLRNERTGHLFEGSYKNVRVENESQLLCLNRYIHVNPISAGLAQPSNLLGWKWSSLSEYINKPKDKICNCDLILGNFKNTKDYLDFVLADFSGAEKQNLEEIALDDDFVWFENQKESKKAFREKTIDQILRT